MTATRRGTYSLTNILFIFHKAICFKILFVIGIHTYFKINENLHTKLWHCAAANLQLHAAKQQDTELAVIIKNIIIIIITIISTLNTHTHAHNKFGKISQFMFPLNLLHS